VDIIALNDKRKVNLASLLGGLTGIINRSLSRASHHLSALDRDKHPDRCNLEHAYQYLLHKCWKRTSMENQLNPLVF